MSNFPNFISRPYTVGEGQACEGCCFNGPHAPWCQFDTLTPSKIRLAFELLKPKVITWEGDSSSEEVKEG